MQSKSGYLRKITSLLLIITMVFVPTIDSNAFSGTISFSGPDLETTNIGVPFSDGQTVNGIQASDIAGIQIDMFGSPDKINPVGLFKFTDFQNVIFLDEVPSYPYTYLVIESSDGTDFSLNSIFINNINCDQELVSVETMRDGSAIGTVDLTLDLGGMQTQFTQFADLTPEYFGNIDKVVIKSITPTSLDDVTVGIGDINISSPIFPSGPALTADSTDNSVDNDIEIIFASDASFENAITSVTYNGNTLEGAQYSVSSGKLTLKPSVAGNNYLRTPSTANVVVFASGYGDSTVSQTILHGVATALDVIQNIKAPTSNSGVFAQQPKLAIKDIYGNVCTNDNTSIVTVAKEDSGTWTLTGTTTATVNNGIASFLNLGTTNTALVNNAQLSFSLAGLSNVTSEKVNLPAPASSGGGSSSGSSSGESTTTPAAPSTQGNVVVIVNGQNQSAGKELISTENGKTLVTVSVENTVIESKIDEAIKNNPSGQGNIIQVPISNSTSDIAKVELTGDIVKKLEDSAFNVSVKRDTVEYIIPAEEFTISKVAENLGVSEVDLKDIKVEVKITKLDSRVIQNYDEVAKSNGAELIFPPVAFEILATTTNSDGTTSKIGINKFDNYVERIMEIPAGVDPSKITTGIVFNPDGTYNHVPTQVFSKDGRWYAKLNSLTNSNYSVLYNPVRVKSVDNHWAKESVNEMASRLIIFNSESFEPNKSITRADFAEYIVRALGLYSEGLNHNNKFKDISINDERAIAIFIANEYGIVSGYKDGTFKPNALITREEAMTMYKNAMSITNLTGNDANRYKIYTDFSNVSTWASGYVKEVLAAHVFNGTSKTTISPKSNLTYAEAATAIRNLLLESNLIN
ncbi:S-layer homology domain-containing protein [Acetoanaerobium sticklandii]|uniref:S-layer homology domain-containing protein n=1 Tax=Acetoanaerobium sticklandii TaxID=1511 RepID=UPI003A952692